jgi:hypothetical protein
MRRTHRDFCYDPEAIEGNLLILPSSLCLSNTSVIGDNKQAGLGNAAPWGGLRNPDRFRIREFANSHSAKLAAKAGTFHSTERQTRIGCDHRVAVELVARWLLLRREIFGGEGSCASH